MSHQIFAEVDPYDDYNHEGEPPAPPAHLNLMIERKNGIIEFWAYTKPETVAEQTRALCNYLIDSGYLDFKISHSI